MSQAGVAPVTSPAGGSMKEALGLWPEVYGFALQLTGDGDRAGDLAQEAFSRLHRARRDLSGREALRPYLFRIVRNLTHDESRRMRPGALEDPERTVADALRHAPESVLTAAEDRAAVRGALEELKPLWRAVLYLRDGLDHTYAEIAQTLGLTEDTVRMTLHRARARLRDKLRDYDPRRPQ